MKKPTPKKHRHFSMTTYISLEEIREYVKKDCIAKYAYILHDKDEKEPHYHLVVTYKNPRTWDGVKKDFSTYAQNTCVEVVKSLDGVLDYLTHKNQPEKYQYEEIAVTNFGYFRGDYRRNVELTQDIAITIVEAILDDLPKRELLRLFGREYAIYRRQYESLANDIRIEETPALPKPVLVDVDGCVSFDSLPDNGAVELIEQVRFEDYIKQFRNLDQGTIPVDNNTVKE